MTARDDWLTVSLDGLRKQVAGKDRGFIIYELAQNTFDEMGASRLDITLEPVPNRSQVWLTVTDNAPEGFRDLSHAWTLFAESYKKSNPEQRGRFNLGEKLILALADEATIVSTKGGVSFNPETGRKRLRRKRDAGTEVRLLLKATRDEIDEMRSAVDLLIPPPGIAVYFHDGSFSLDDGQAIVSAKPIATVWAKLPTVIANEDGVLKHLPSGRMTDIQVYEPTNGAWLYEMGIPVVAIEDKWSVNIGQKIPVGMDRDNVTATYLAKVRVAVLNDMADSLTKDEAAEPWVKTATSRPEITADAFGTIMDKRFGEQRVMNSPNDREAGMKAVSKGYTLVYGNQLSGEEGKNMRRFRDDGNDQFRPAGRVFPTPKPYSTDPDAPPVTVIPVEKYTGRQRQVVNYCKHVSKLLLGEETSVRLVRTRNNFVAAYSKWLLDLNVTRIGRRFFDDTSPEGLQRVNDLLIHEFGHHYASNHLAADYHDALTKLGAQLVAAALRGDLKPKRYGFQTKPGDRPKKPKVVFTL